MRYSYNRFNWWFTDTTALNYSPQANFDDGSCTWDCNAFAISVDSVSNVTGCYGDRNGLINTSLNMSGTATWLDNGSSVLSRSSLTAGIYTLVATTPDGNCVDTAQIALSQPSAIIFNATVLDQTDTIGNGSITPNVSGGTPCYVSNSIGSGSVSTSLSYLWYTYYMDNNTEITYTAAELAASGISSGDAISSFAFNVTDPRSAYTMNNAQLSVNGQIVWSGSHLPVAGLNEFVASAPYTYTGGDLVLNWCFDNNSYGSSLYPLLECTFTPGTKSNFGDFSTNSGCVAINPLTARSYRPNLYMQVAPGGAAYTYSWSTGDTTANLSNLVAGQYTLTATDCNGCSSSATFTVNSVTPITGCTDPLAFNYDSTANVDDGSCVPVVLGCNNPLAEFRFNCKHR